MQKAKSIALILGVLTMSFLVGYLVLAWTEPSQAPPGGNVAAPINVGSTGQIKTGTLRVGGLISDSWTYLAAQSGNVGIGTASPGYKLDVSGDARVQGWVRVTGQRGIYFQDYGGGWYMLDTTWVRSYNDKSIYTAGEMRASTVRGNSQLCIGADCRTSWPATGGGGTVTSVGSGAGLTGGPITTSGTLSVNTAAISTCTGSGQKILWDSTNNRFTCGTDQGISSESDTLQTVTNRGNTTSQDISVKNLTLGYSVSEGNIVNVNAVTGYNDLFLKGNSSENAPVYIAGSQLVVYVGGSERMSITTAGNVGIGTPSPGAKLEVGGQVKITGGSPGAGKVLTSDASGLASWQPGGGIGGSGTANYLAKFTAGTTIGNSQIYDTGTNVGIGTTSPDPNHKLTVWGSMRSQGAYIEGNINYSGYLTKLIVDSRLTGQSDAFLNGIRDIYIGGAPGRRPSPGRALVDAYPQLWLNYGPDWPDTVINGNRVLILGNIGIGKWPEYKLDVLGNAYFRNDVIIDGKVGIGTMPVWQFEVNGDARIHGRFEQWRDAYLASLDGSTVLIGAAGSLAGYKLIIKQGTGKGLADGWSSYSSREYKKDITYLSAEDYSQILAKLENLDVVRYRLKSDSEEAKLKLGVIAEESPEEILSEDGNSLSLNKAISFLLAVTKAQQEEIKELKAEISKIKEIK